MKITKYKKLQDSEYGTACLENLYEVESELNSIEKRIQEFKEKYYHAG